MSFSSVIGAPILQWSINVDVAPNTATLGGGNGVILHDGVGGGAIDYYSSQNCVVIWFDKNGGVLYKKIVARPALDTLSLISCTPERICFADPINSRIYEVAKTTNGVNESFLSYTFSKSPSNEYIRTQTQTFDHFGFFTSYNNGTSVTINRFSYGIQQTSNSQFLSGWDGGNFKMQWLSETGRSYQIQKSNDLSVWTNEGNPITGTGSTMEMVVPREGPKTFYRIQVP